jgi:hypothetical protein
VCCVCVQVRLDVSSCGVRMWVHILKIITEITGLFLVSLWMLWGYYGSVVNKQPTVWPQSASYVGSCMKMKHRALLNWHELSSVSVNSSLTIKRKARLRASYWVRLYVVTPHPGQWQFSRNVCRNVFTAPGCRQAWFVLKWNVKLKRIKCKTTNAFETYKTLLLVSFLHQFHCIGIAGYSASQIMLFIVFACLSPS